MTKHMLNTSDARHSKPQPTPHYRVLKTGKFNSMITVLFLVYPESLTTRAATSFPQCCHGNTQCCHGNNHHNTS